MKISHVLSYMGLEYTIRGDNDYNDNLSLDDFDITWVSQKPSDEAFHKAAIEVQKKLQENDCFEVLQELFNNKAMEKNYSGELSILSYLYSTNEKWFQEAKIFNEWRDKCWQKAYELQVSNQQISIEEFLSQMPQLNW
jgi:hypothetical protein